MHTTAGTVLDGCGKVFKDAKHVIGIHVCEAKGTNAWGIDNPAAGECILGGEGSATDWVEVCLPLPTPDTSPVSLSASGTNRLTRVDLPTPECPMSAVTWPSMWWRTASSPSSTPASTTVTLRSANSAAKGQDPWIGFGQAQDGVDIAHKRSDEGALDKPRARRRIGHGGDDEHLVRIRHHDALIRVGVIGRAPEDRGALFEFHYAR